MYLIYICVLVICMCPVLACLYVPMCVYNNNNNNNNYNQVLRIKIAVKSDVKNGRI